MPTTEKATRIMPVDWMMVNRQVYAQCKDCKSLPNGLVLEVRDIGFANLTEVDLMVKISASSGDGFTVNIYVDSEAFDFLTHLRSGLPLVIYDGHGMSQEVFGAELALQELSLALAAAGVESDASKGGFNRVQYYLQQAESLVSWWNYDFGFRVLQATTH